MYPELKEKIDLLSYIQFLEMIKTDSVNANDFREQGKKIKHNYPFILYRHVAIKHTFPFYITRSRSK